MKVLSLRCEHGHGFEGWFGSEDDYRLQCERGLVECPLCGSGQISRLPTAPRLNLSPSREVSVADPRPTPEQQSVETLWLRAVRHVMAHTEDVGERFTDEARRIHYGETRERGIRGQASAEQTQALREEGIEVHALPVPKALKGPLQ